ncbi:hypothetical protein NDU88_007143 [Pleurodeles waltl]|uniref:Uncharacterized protein n=1 Tax=Pleurodeles waltl TaxID=8319 RepID=A0AAV7VRY3_PLEWA|nr:hypothetical protein NDU88_007143 [Pleurodeles waltl]
MERFLWEICQEITSFKTDFKSCLNDLRRDVTAVSDRVDDLGCTMDSRAEDKEALWRRVNALEEQHISLQAKQEDSENHRRHNNIRIREIPRSAE